MALRAEGILARALPHASAAASYSSTTSTLLLPALMNAAPTLPPITYTLPFTTPAVAWLRGVGIGAYVWNEYNALNLAHVICAIVLIGLVGLALDLLFLRLAKAAAHQEAQP